MYAFPGNLSITCPQGYLHTSLAATPPPPRHLQVREMYAFSVALAMNTINTELKPPGQTAFIAQVGRRWLGEVAHSACDSWQQAGRARRRQQQNSACSRTGQLLHCCLGSAHTPARRVHPPSSSPSTVAPPCSQLPIDESLGNAHAFHYTQVGCMAAGCSLECSDA